jgi:CRP/FNR family cyclic AMP-dependent transcriptional regulator
MATDLSRTETIEMLSRTPLFEGLTKRQLTAIAKAADFQTYEPGAVLVREQEDVQRLIIIRSGTAAVTRRGMVAEADGHAHEGASRRLATVGPGDVVGELSIIDGKRASASVVAETPLEALLLYRSRFAKLLSSMPELYPRLLVAMVARIRAIDHRNDATS